MIIKIIRKELLYKLTPEKVLKGVPYQMDIVNYLLELIFSSIVSIFLIKYFIDKTINK